MKIFTGFYNLQEIQKNSSSELRFFYSFICFASCVNNNIFRLLENLYNFEFMNLLEISILLAFMLCVYQKETDRNSSAEQFSTCCNLWRSGNFSQRIELGFLSILLFFAFHVFRFQFNAQMEREWTQRAVMNWLFCLEVPPPPKCVCGFICIYSNSLFFWET